MEVTACERPGRSTARHEVPATTRRAPSVAAAARKRQHQRTLGSEQYAVKQLPRRSRAIVLGSLASVRRDQAHRSGWTPGGRRPRKVRHDAQRETLDATGAERNMHGRMALHFCAIRTISPVPGALKWQAPRRKR